MDDTADLPPSTMPQGVGVSMHGFATQELAERLGNAVFAYINLLGRHIDLSRLDGITVAIDYDAALANLDRGLDDLRPLSRSNSDEMQGVAMSPAVMRDGEVKTHLVFAASILVALVDEDATEIQQITSIGVLAHECAHVEVTARKEAAIPEARLGTRIEGYERAVCFQIAEVCWDEYAACRISAPFATDQNAYHAETLTAVVARARADANTAIKSYRLHGDIDRLMFEAGAALCQPLKAAAYLLGGLDAADLDWAELPEVRRAIEDGGYGDLIDALHGELRLLWDSQDEWNPSLDTFGSLCALAKRTFESGGIFLRTGSDGRCNIRVPYSPHTMP